MAREPCESAGDRRPDSRHPGSCGCISIVHRGSRAPVFLDNRRLEPYIALIRLSRDHRCPSMKNVYEVLRQKELELTRLEKEVEALRVAAPLLSADDEADNDDKLTLASSSAVNATPQPDHSGWEDRAKRRP